MSPTILFMITLVILRDILRPKKIVHLSISRLLNKATLILLFLSCASYAQWSEPPSEEIVIRGGWLFDGISDTRRLNKGIVIREGKIVEIDANIQGGNLSGTNVIDLTESETILPGMIDLHAHYNFDLVDVGRVEEVVNNGIIFLANGVTSTWSAGEYLSLIHI